MGELIGYARCSTVLQDPTAQRQALAELGVPDDRIYLDKGHHRRGHRGPAVPVPATEDTMTDSRPDTSIDAAILDRMTERSPSSRPSSPTPTAPR